jgi:hypothetical protein
MISGAADPDYMQKNFTMAAVFAAAALGLAGCSSVTVKELNNEGSKVAVRPAQIVVLPFAVDTARIKQYSGRKHPGQLGSEAQQLLNDYLVKELAKLGVPATNTPARAAAPNVWVVSGRFTRLEEGSRLLRMSMGLGLGGTKMETQVDVNAGKMHVMHFATSGGSNAMPGAVTTPVPFTGLPAALKGASDGVTDDAARTARMITGAIGAEMVKRGWLATDPYQPKMSAR